MGPDKRSHNGDLQERSHQLLHDSRGLLSERGNLQSNASHSARMASLLCRCRSQRPIGRLSAVGVALDAPVPIPEVHMPGPESTDAARRRLGNRKLEIWRSRIPEECGWGRVAVDGRQGLVARKWQFLKGFSLAATLRAAGSIRIVVARSLPARALPRNTLGVPCGRAEMMFQYVGTRV